MTAGINTKPPVGSLRHGPRRHQEPEDIPIGSTVRTPTGKLAKVLGYRGAKGRRPSGGDGGKDHRCRLLCQYLNPQNKRFDKVLLAPELVTVVDPRTEKEAA